jgi:hypothetical protein
LAPPRHTTVALSLVLWFSSSVTFSAEPNFRNAFQDAMKFWKHVSKQFVVMSGMWPFPAFAAEIRTPLEQELTDITHSIQEMSRRQPLVVSTWPLFLILA